MKWCNIGTGLSREAVDKKIADLFVLNKGYLMIFYFLMTSFLFNFLVYSESAVDQILAENDRISNESEAIQALYKLNDNEKWRDITPEVLKSPYTSLKNKEIIREKERRIIVFRYPSDGLSIKGFISFTPSPTHHPLLILYRGGTENFALLNPGIIYAIFGNYTVVSSALRGGVSEGKDEYGGKDVDDMKNLMDFLPALAEEIGITLQPPCVFMLGLSRGGLQMFLTLARFPELQNRVNKVVTLSSILDLHQQIRNRPIDMKKMFEESFGMSSGKQAEAWIAKRDPINTVPYIKKSLPILIVQGTADKRVKLEEGYHMTEELKESGNDVSYWEVPKGEHVLLNNPYILNDIVKWLESNSACVSIKMHDATAKK
jgi:dipeptidyl aminopeptidase/acylaminoacyl peptidase